MIKLCVSDALQQEQNRTEKWGSTLFQVVFNLEKLTQDLTAKQKRKLEGHL